MIICAEEDGMTLLQISAQLHRLTDGLEQMDCEAIKVSRSKFRFIMR